MRRRRLWWCLLLWGVCLTTLGSCRGVPLHEQVMVTSTAAVSSGVYHPVRRGQTLWSIAQAYGVDVDTLKRINRLAAPHVLRVGQQLYIPGATQRRQVASRCPCKPASHPAALSQPPPSRSARLTSPVQLIWPLRGPITRGFDADGRRRHNGIDIAAPEGTLIRAAADGKVIFSDWGPRGYGRLVIVRHTGALVTVYAHNHRNLVRSGQKVQQGTPIATVGRSGRATGYHLHFEIRQKTVPISPFSFLPGFRNLAWLRHP